MVPDLTVSTFTWLYGVAIKTALIAGIIYGSESNRIALIEIELRHEA